MKYKIGTKLVCMRDFYMTDGFKERVFTNAKSYEILSYSKTYSDDYDRYVFIDDDGEKHKISENVVNNSFRNNRPEKLERILK